MNKKRWKRIASLLLVFCMVLQTVLLNVAYVVHADVGEENFIITGVKLYDANNQEVSDGADVSMLDTLTVRYLFEIKNKGVPGDSIRFKIPRQMEICDKVKIKLVDGDTNLRFAEVSVEKNGEGVITLSDDSTLLNHLEGWFQIKTTWNYEEVSGDEDQELVFEVDKGTTVTIPVHVGSVTVDAVVDLEKKGSQEENGDILWKIRVKPSTNPAGFPIKYVRVTDEIPLDQEFVEGSWQIAPANPGSVWMLSDIAAYGFVDPAGTGPAVASPSSYRSLLRTNDSALTEHTDTKEDGSDTAPIWDKKEDFLYQVLEDEEDTDPDASPSEASPASARYSFRARKPKGKTIQMPGFRIVDGESQLESGFEFLPADIDENTGKEKNHGTLVYQFPSGIGIKDSYVITFKTRMCEEGMKAAGTVGPDEAPGHPGGDPAKYNFKNNAAVTWPKDAVCDPQSPDTDAGVIGNQEAEAVVKYDITYLIKNGNVEAGANGIKWTIHVNPNGLQLAEDTYLTDEIQHPEYVLLAQDSMGRDKVFFQREGENYVQLERCPGDGGGGVPACASFDPDTKRCSDPSHFTYVDHTLQYVVGGGKIKGDFWYYTKIDSAEYARASYPSIENKVGLGYGDGYYGYGDAQPVWPIQDWITKSGVYNKSTHEITWTIDINTKKQALADAVFTDILNLDKTLPNAQEYKPGSFYVDDNLVEPSTASQTTKFTIETVNDTSQTLSYAFGDIEDVHKVRFTTIVLSEGIYQSNQSNEKYMNTATLEAEYEGEVLEQSAKAEVNVPSEVIKKSKGEPYDHVQNLLTWKITVNGNRMPITDAAVTDVLEEGQEVHKLDGGAPDVTVKKVNVDGTEVDPESHCTVTVEEVALPAPSSGNTQKITIAFPGEIQDTYIITVKTQLTDSKMQEWFKKENDKLMVYNKATLTGDNLLQPVDSNQCSQELEHSIVKKTAIYEDGDDFVTWRVLINQHQVPIPLETGGGPVDKVYLEDQLMTGTTLDLDSIKLYRGVTINPDGSYDLSSSGVEVFSGNAEDSAKKLTYGKEQNLSDKKNIYYTAGKFQFVFTGETENGTPITEIDAINSTIFENKAYVLEFVTNIAETITAVTNQIDLKGTGHSSTSEEQRVGFSTGEGGGLGRRARIDIEKVDKYDHSIKLAGAEFALYDKSARAIQLGLADQSVTDTVGADGKLTFSQLYFNNDYQLRETKAPDGYKQPQLSDPWYIDMTPGSGGVTVSAGPAAAEDTSDHTFGLGKDDLSANGGMKLTVENTPKFGWVSIKKVGSEDTIPLEGAEFTVYKKGTNTIAKMYTDLSAANGGPVDAKVRTGADGIAYIDGLRCGEYDLRETGSPAHYAADRATSYSIKIPANVAEDYDPVAAITDSSYTRPDGAKGTVVKNPSEELSLPAIIKNIPVGDIEVRKLDRKDHSKLVDGAKIGLYSDSGCTNKLQEKTSATGKVAFTNLPAGTYYVKETSSPSGYRLNTTDVLTVTLERQAPGENGAAESVVCTTPEDDRILYNDPIGGVVVKKTESGKPGSKLAGAEFTLYTDEGCTTKVGPAQGLQTANPATTNADGEVKFEGLDLGTYYCKETKRPTAYKINTNTEVIELVQAGETKTLTYEDEPILASLKIKKTDSKTHAEVEGAKIQLEDASGNLVGTAVRTGSDGYAQFDNLKVGVYYATELEAPHGYIKNETTRIKLEIKDPGNVSGDLSSAIIDKDTTGAPAVIENEPVGSFKFKKVDAVTGAPLAGAKIHLTPSVSGPSVAAIPDQTTGEDGTCLFENLSYGDYKWEEIEAPTGYLLPDEHPSGTITIDKNTEPVELDAPIANRPLPKFHFQIRKIGEPDGRLLDGAVYEVYQKNKPDQAIARAETVNGVADFGVLSKGIEYYYQEVTAPKGYRLDTEKYEFKISDDGSNEVKTEVKTARDQLSKGSFTLIKVDSSQGAEPIQGAVFRLSYLSEGSYGAPNPNLNQNVWEQTSNAAGEVKFEGLPLGRYRIQEISAPAQYHVDRDWNYEFELTRDGEAAVDPIGHHVNFGIYKGDLTVTKTDAGQPSADGMAMAYQPLEGAKIGIFLQSDEQLVREGVTGADGKVTFEDLLEGDYYYQELEAPDGYALNTEKYEFTIGKEGGKPDGAPEDGVVLERVLRNELIVGEAAATKVDAKDGKLLAGAELTLYSAAGGKLESKVTDSQGKAVFEDLLKGKYYIQETKAPDGYILDETQYSFEITQVDEKAEIEIKNYKVYSAQVHVEKVDASSNRQLAGAEITLFTEAGVSLAAAVTDSQGKAVFEELLKGKYYIQETKAPAGYVLDETRHPFEVTDPDEVIRIQLTNKKIYSGSTGGGGGSDGPKPGAPGDPGETKPGEVGPGIPPAVPADPAAPAEPGEPAVPVEPVVPEPGTPPDVTENPDGTVTIVPPDVPGGTTVVITKPDGTEVYRGVTDTNGVTAALPPGDYFLLTIDDAGVPLANMPFTIGDMPVPLAAPAAGDESAPLALLMTILLGAIAGSGFLLWNRKKFLEEAGESGIVNEKKTHH